MNKRSTISILFFVLVSLISFCTSPDFENPEGLAGTTITIDSIPPVITILADNPMTMNVSNSFVMPEIMAYDSIDGDVSDSIVTTGTVDTSDTGTNLIYISAKDLSDNSSSCTLTVIVEDKGPKLVLNAPDTVKITPEETYVEPGYSAKSPDGSVDLSFAVKITYYGLNDSIVDSTQFGANEGLYKIKYEVEYNAIAKTAWRFVLISNNDFTAPVITIVGKNPDTLWTWESYTDSGAFAIDNLDDSVAVTTVDSVAVGIVGNYRVHYSASDSSGNTTDTFRIVIVELDTTTPVLTILPKDSVIVELNDSVIFPSITAVDAVDGDLTSKVVLNGSVDSSIAGIYPVIASVTDTTGNSTSDTIIVCVHNYPTIVLNGLNPDTVLSGAAQYNDQGAYITDNINDTITGILGVGTVNSTIEGSYFLTYKYTDSSGNIADSVVRTVVVQNGVDTISPVITIINPGPDTIWIGESYVDAGATAVDNKDGQIDSLIVTTKGIDSTTVGVYQITYTVADAAGNIATATKMVVVIADTTAPIITITGTNPANIEVGEAVPSITVTAIDDKDGDLTGSITSTGTINNSVPGTYYKIYSVSDVAGNIALDTFIVNVGDHTAPVLTIITQNPTTINHGDTFSDSVTAIDNVDGDITANIVKSGQINSSVLGTQYLYYSITDAAGNSSYDTLAVTVVDLVAPVLTISGANPITIPVGASWTNPAATAVDDVDGDISGSILVNGSVNTAISGVYNLIYSVSDASGNEGKDTLVVDVSAAPDTINPVITIAGNNPDTVGHGSTYTEPVVTAIDNVDGDITANVVKTGIPVNTNNVGTSTFIYTVADAAGNDTSVTLTVEVVDITAPILTISGTDLDTIDFGSAYSNPTVTAIDAVDGDISVNIVTTGSISNTTLGNQIVVYSITDAAGNESKDTLNVYVKDEVAPVISISGSNPLTVAYGATFTEPAVTASDNADGDLSAKISKSGSVNTGAIGSYSITYTVSDTSGNADTAVLNVTVSDLTPPVLTISGSNPLSVNEGYTYTEPTVTSIDDLDGNISAGIVKSGDVVNQNSPGTYNVIFTSTDAAGNISTETLVVNVIDDSQAPVITISGSNPLSIDSGTAFSEPSVTASDDVDGNITAKIVKTGDVVDVNAVNAYDIIYTVTDSAGNVATDTLVVNVVSTGGGTIIYNQVTPPATDWDKFGSVGWTTMDVSNESDALKLSNGDYEKTEHRVISKNGNTFNITSGDTYRVTFEIKNTANSYNSFNVGFANINATSYATVSFVGSTATGYTNSTTYTSISVDVVATATGTYCLGFDITQSSNSPAVDIFITDLKVVKQ